MPDNITLQRYKNIFQNKGIKKEFILFSLKRNEVLFIKYKVSKINYFNVNPNPRLPMLVWPNNPLQLTYCLKKCINPTNFSLNCITRGNVWILFINYEISTKHNHRNWYQRPIWFLESIHYRLTTLTFKKEKNIHKF